MQVYDLPCLSWSKRQGLRQDIMAGDALELFDSANRICVRFGNCLLADDYWRNRDLRVSKKGFITMMGALKRCLDLVAIVS